MSNQTNKKVANLLVSMEEKFIFAIATSVYGNYYKSKLFGGDGSSPTLTDVAVCIKSPLLFSTSKFCNK